MVRVDMNRNYRLIKVWVRFDQGLIEGCFDRLYMGNCWVMWLDWVWIDGKFINSKGVNGIIREIEGYVKGQIGISEGY